MKLWSYDKPTMSGAYYVNAGDAVTPANCKEIKLSFKHGKNIQQPQVLHDDEGDPVTDYGDYCKFLPIDYEALNKIGNE